MTHRPVGAKLFHAEGQTGITKERVAFYTFANALEITQYYLVLYSVNKCACSYQPTDN